MNIIPGDRVYQNPTIDPNYYEGSGKVMWVNQIFKDKIETCWGEIDGAHFLYYSFDMLNLLEKISLEKVVP
jgi:hypothetical protein